MCVPGIVLAGVPMSLLSQRGLQARAVSLDVTAMGMPPLTGGELLGAPLLPLALKI